MKVIGNFLKIHILTCYKRNLSHASVKVFEYDFRMTIKIRSILTNFWLSSYVRNILSRLKHRLRKMTCRQCICSCCPKLSSQKGQSLSLIYSSTQRNRKFVIFLNILSYLWITIMIFTQKMVWKRHHERKLHSNEIS